jgi:protein tyrosine phosphatase (PTP) superfamily phosphohydrolase (DUF442 family)
MANRWLLTLIGVAFVGACGGERHDTVRLEEVSGPVVWGAADNVTRVRHLWFSRQPDAAGLLAAKQNGIALVVDLRAPGERDWDEAAAASDAGLRYVNIPIAEKEPFSEAALAEIEAVVAANPEQQILLHCSSGNRAAAWLTTHLVRKHHMPFADALEIGRRAGITKPEIVAKTAAVLGEKVDEGDTDWRERGAAAVRPFKQRLLGELTAALATSPENAIEVCRMRAPAIAGESGSATLEIGRTSHRLRNPENAPRDWVQPLLAEYVANPRDETPRVVRLASGAVGYVEPIHAAPMCLTCHGDSIAPALHERIRALYPDDQATGFQSGDFRGLVWVEMTEAGSK